MEDTNSAVIVRLLCGYCAVRAGKLLWDGAKRLRDAPRRLWDAVETAMGRRKAPNGERGEGENGYIDPF